MEKGFKYLIIGFILLHLNIDIGFVNIMPQTISYFLFLGAVKVLSKEYTGILKCRIPLYILIFFDIARLFLQETFIFMYPKDIGIDLVVSLADLIFLYYLTEGFISISEKYRLNMDNTFNILFIINLITTFFINISEIYKINNVLDYKCKSFLYIIIGTYIISRIIFIITINKLKKSLLLL